MAFAPRMWQGTRPRTVVLQMTGHPSTVGATLLRGRFES